MSQTHGPCVCVQNAEEKSGNQRQSKQEPQDGSVCVLSYTAKQTVLLFCCCFVVSQSASSSGGFSPRSASTFASTLLEWLE